MKTLKDFFKKRRNKTFYITALAQLLIAIQLVLVLFGYDDILNEAMQNKILSAANAILIFLGTLGIVKNTADHSEDEE